MAPRGKRRKAGLMRMDAALDAMRPLGFTESVVRKSVRSLLKVYGDDGWGFLEDSAYKVLIDAILEQNEQHQDEEHQSPPEIELKDGGTVSEAGANEISEHHKIIEEDLCSKICEKQRSDDDDDEQQDETPQPKSGVRGQLASSCAASSSIDCGPKLRRHKPCYGWISDDDAEDDFDVLTPEQNLKPS